MTSTLIKAAASGPDALERAWASPPGLPGWIGAVNHKQIGKRFIVTAFVFLLIGGIEATLIRLQLARPEAEVLGPEFYNQIFTMHGTTMMFLFAVPILEGLAMYFVPLMIGTRDLPFPRLNAFGYWVYLFGGILLHWSFLTGSVPDGGWFMYPPLTSDPFSPGRNIDYWLLGVTFLEVSGIVGALEIAVVILKQRAPGMALSRMPLFVWSSLAMAGMILFAFPAIIGASVLLEVERKFGAPFYDPGGGGNPLLWQHLFWVFGHPEVYIMLLPATGIVSTIVAAQSRRPLVGYVYVVAAFAAIAILSFGLWVHHMFATGLPALVLALFSASSILIAIPNGVQVFSWIATMLRGRPRFDTPMLYCLGFLLVFVPGGITGVMVASASFDQQVHDSFFVVAHFHYVLVGGVVFPILGGLHWWFPKLTGRRPSELGGKLSFWMIVIGFNVTFFPQHHLGFLGMPRRVYTYRSEMGWDGYNLVSSIGALLLAAGFAVFTANLVISRYRGVPAGDDPWDAATLEWATSSPPPPHNFDEIALVGARDPLWDRRRPELSPVAEAAVGELREPAGGRRELVRTSIVDAEPEALFAVPGPSYWPLVAAAAITVFLVGALVDALVLAVGGVAGTVVALIAWLAPAAADDHEMLDTRPIERAAPGRAAGFTGTLFGIASLAAVLFALVYAYFYLSVTGDQWPPPGFDEPELGRSAVGVAVLLAVLAPLTIARRAAQRGGRGPLLGGLAGTLALGGIFTAIQSVELARLPFSVDDHAYAAAFVTLQVAFLLLVAVGLVIGLVMLRRAVRAPLGERGRGGLDVLALWWWFLLAAWPVLWAVLYLWPKVAP